jgi:hypothetical protein
MLPRECGYQYRSAIKGLMVRNGFGSPNLAL